MSNDFSQVEQSALSLSPAERAKLAGTLLRSLDPQLDDDPEVVAERWEEVILARSDALHRGEVKLVDGEEVVSEMRDMVSHAKSATGR